MADEFKNMGRRGFIKKVAGMGAAGLVTRPDEILAQQNRIVYKIEIETVDLTRWSADKYRWIDGKWNSLKSDIIDWLLYLETFRETPARHGDGMWTTGTGLTWENTATYGDPNNRTKITRIVKKRTRSVNKTINRQHLAAYYPRNIPRTSKEWEDHVKLHIFAETLSNLYDRLRANNMLRISDEKLLGLVGMRWLGNYGISNTITKLKTATTQQAIVNASHTVIPRNGGATKRSYACGLMAAGFINRDLLLTLSQDGWSVMPKVAYTRYDRNGNFAGFDISRSTRTEFFNKRKRQTVKHFRDRYFKDLSNSNRQSQPIREEVADNESMRLVLEGLKQFEQGRYANAERLYIQALEKDPNNIEAIADLGLVYLKLGDEMLKAGNTAKAIEYYDRAASFALRARAIADTESDKEFVANAYFNAGVARRSIGDILMSQNRRNEARDHYNRARINFGHAYRFNQRQTYRNNEDAMKSRLEELGDQMSKSLLDEARILRDNRNLPETERWAQIIKEITPEKIKAADLSDLDRAKCWYIWGRACENLEKYNNAFVAYNKVLELAPNSIDAINAEERLVIIAELVDQKKTKIPLGVGFGIAAAVAAGAAGLNKLRKRKAMVLQKESKSK